MKTCTLCLETKPETAFRGYRDAARGLRARCRACLRDDGRRAARPDWTREQWDAHCEKRRSKHTPEDEQRHWRDLHLKKHYGITIEEQDRMLIEQDGRCAICRRTLGKQVCIDHDHVSGMVRSILCHDCNISLGRMDEDRDRLTAAADYLWEHRWPLDRDERDLRDQNRINDRALLDSYLRIPA